MKSKILILLLAMGLLTGCGQNTEPLPGVENMDKNIAVGEDGNLEYDASAEPEESQATESSQETVAEEEPYILTFEASTIDGEPFTSECFSGSKLTMLNIWATYCSPCLREMPDLGEIAAAYDSAEFQIIGIISDVSEDAGEDAIEEAETLIAQTKADYPHLLLSESLYSNLVGAVSAVPTTFFVNQEGEVLGYLVGAYEKSDWEEIISGLLAEVQ